MKPYIIDKCVEAMAKAKKSIPYLDDKIVVGFYEKGVSAGKAWRVGNKVEFNIVLAEENASEFDNTIIHEIAHLVTYQVYPGCNSTRKRI